MATVKISSKVEERVWLDLKAMARESHQSISGVLGEAIEEYLRKRRIRPSVLKHLDDSVADNRELGHLLAR
jgi:predicted transcriptional regulator